MNWTQKELGLLKDLKDQEQLCANKYSRHAAHACDPQLIRLFSNLAQAEARHLQTISQMELGTVPTLAGGSSQSPTFTAAYTGDSREKQTDSFLCADVLAGEKHTSSLYDTCIFEFRDEQARQVLNHIQKEEQEHGKQLYDYMAKNGMN